MVKKTRPAIREYLGASAAIYEKRRGLRKIKERTTQTAIDLLNLPKEKFVLDVGSGSGWSTETIMKNGYEVVGIDISKGMGKISTEKGYVMIVGDMRMMGFRNDIFDGILSISALNFVTENCRSRKEIEKNYTEVASEMSRVLKNGGKAIIEFYPKTQDEESISKQSFLSAGFDGDLFVNTYKKKSGQRFLRLVKTENLDRKIRIKRICFSF